jgi:putative toxin-antitoxin system antitoxin component (TIGR02293 family)
VIVAYGGRAKQRTLKCRVAQGGIIMLHAKEVTTLLGGQRVLGRRLNCEMSCVELIREGLPVASVTAAAKALGLTEEQVLTALRIPKRPIARRNAAGARLNATESERVVRLGRAIARATDALGDREKAVSWLLGKNRALGSVTPLSLLDTDLGLQQVEDILGRIEYGVYS